MNKRYTISILIIGVTALNACGVVRQGAGPVSEGPNSSAMMSVSPVETNVNEQLYSAYETWKGTPYVLGGSGTNGVDCSSFTQIVYRNYFNEQLLRNTRQQLGQGTGVRRQHIRPGDLLFFRTAQDTLHVGIAMENGDFLHASVSKGVMISNLSQQYWAGRYLGARRLL